jgi:NAD(P)-dependent dehydrogenase (short-subunit alcohol dehydrogenase family)
LGSSAIGTGSSTTPAEEVAAAIVASGGEAIANSANVVDDPQSIVDAAIENFGRLDIVVNNAGINKAQAFGASPMEFIKRHMEVHFYGTVGVTSAAWEHLVASGNGRIVNTCSPTLFGFKKQTPYVSAKGAVFALTRTLALEAADEGIMVNAIAPTAATRMSDEMDAPDEYKQWMRDTLPVELVSPLVAYLSHDSCEVNGETLLVAGGKVQRMTLGETEGFFDANLNPESIQSNIATILESSTNVVRDLRDQTAVPGE